jgi:hypothetical protein
MRTRRTTLWRPPTVCRVNPIPQDPSGIGPPACSGLKVQVNCFYQPLPSGPQTNVLKNTYPLIEPYNAGSPPPPAIVGDDLPEINGYFIGLWTVDYSPGKIHWAFAIFGDWEERYLDPRDPSGQCETTTWANLRILREKKNIILPDSSAWQVQLNLDLQAIPY